MKIFVDGNSLFVYFFFQITFLDKTSLTTPLFIEEMYEDNIHVGSIRTHYPDSESTSLKFLLRNTACLAEKQQIPIL